MTSHLVHVILTDYIYSILTLTIVYINCKIQLHINLHLTSMLPKTSNSLIKYLQELTLYRHWIVGSKHQGSIVDSVHYGVMILSYFSDFNCILVALLKLTRGISYILSPWLRNLKRYFTLNICLYVFVELTKMLIQINTNIVAMVRT